MTIIAVDVRAGLMVADTQVGGDDGTADYHTPKIVRTPDGSLVGASGLNAACLGFMAWARSGFKGKPKADLDGADFTAIRLTPERELHVWVDGVISEVALNTVLAIGSGRQVFEAARLAGADMQTAAAIACRLVPTCGLPLTVLRLEDGE